MAKPKLRFPEFTDEWEEKQLKDFMFFKNGLNADKDKFGSGIKFISVMDILNNPFITYDVIRGKVNIDEKTLDNYSVTYGDVLFQRSSETREDAGKSNVYLDKENIATFGGFVIRGKKTGDYAPEFMNSLLKSQRVRKEITNKAQGAQHVNVGQETLENVSITLPTIKEQKRIAEFLSSIDDIIQVQEEEIFALEEQKKGIMQKLFNREVRFKTDDGSEFPEWEERKWGSIGQFFKSGNLSKSDLSEEGTPCILYGELYTKYNEIADTIYSKTNVPCEVVSEKGDVIIPKSGETPEDISTASCIPYDGVALGGDLIIFRSNCILGTYLSYLISNKKKWEIAKIAQGKSIVHINEKSLAKIDIEFPCIAEQQKIVDCLSAYDEAIQIKKDKLEIWKEIKKGLLQQMFV